MNRLSWTSPSPVELVPCVPETRLTFHSEPFTQDTEIAGLNLVVQSDAPDFDLWARMVLLDGSAVRPAEDIRRAFSEQLLQERTVEACSSHQDSV